MRRRCIIVLILGFFAAMGVLAVVTPTPKPGKATGAGIQRVYVQMHHRCREVLKSERLRISPSPSLLYILLKDCIKKGPSKLLNRMPGPYRGYYEELPLTNAFVVEVTDFQRRWLEKQTDEVEFVAVPTIVTLPKAEPPIFAAATICRQSSRPNNCSPGIVIGIVDSGLDWSVPSTRKHYRGLSASGQVDHGYNWRDAYNGPTQSACPGAEPCDTRIDRHGTSVSGVISAETQDDEAITYMHCRAAGNLDGTDVALHQCLNFFLAPTDANGLKPRSNLAPDIINASMGGCQDVRPSACHELDGAIEALNTGGILVVAAAGTLIENSNTYTANSLPALSGYSLTIGGIGGLPGQAASTPNSPSGPNFGPCKPDFVIRDPSYWVPSQTPGLCNELEGTSFDAPQITALVARMLLVAEPLRKHPAAVKEILIQSKLEHPSPPPCNGQSVPNRQFGYGEINSVDALDLARKVTPSTAPIAACPTPTPTPRGL